MVRVAVDAMGGDHAPREIVCGAIAALSSLKKLHLILVGNQDKIESVLKDVDYPADRLQILHAEEVILSDDDPGLSVRSKKKSSMVKALETVRSGQADAVLSAGNTGALMAGGLLFLGRLENISRPALLTPVPSFSGKPVLFLDVGANMDARPEQMLKYAIMGRIYAQDMFGYSNPRIALLNVGTEPNKGNNQTRKAYELFRSHVPGFCGNVEGTNVFFDAADIVVCDGFVGNIFIKTIEGLSRAILGYFRNEITGNPRHKAGAFLLQPVFMSLRGIIDDSGYGGALLMGVNGLCIKCHGSTKAKSVEQAILKQAYPFVEKNVIEKLKTELDLIAGTIGGNSNHA